MKGEIEQQLANRLKVLRTAIRLKHSIAADEELNRVLDEEKKKFMKQIHKGQLPKPLDTGTALGA